MGICRRYPAPSDPEYGMESHGRRIGGIPPFGMAQNHLSKTERVDYNRGNFSLLNFSGPIAE